MFGIISRKKYEALVSKLEEQERELLNRTREIVRLNNKIRDLQEPKLMEIRIVNTPDKGYGDVFIDEKKLSGVLNVDVKPISQDLNCTTCPSTVTLVMRADVTINDFKSGGTHFNFGDSKWNKP